jgi:ribonuclease Z
MSALEVTLLGTGSPIPDAMRAGPSTLVQAGGHHFLFDCGRGVLLRTAAVGVGANQLTATLLTHLHSDHLTDLNDVITTRWVTTFAPSPLVVIGPPRTREVVDGILASLRPDVGYRLAHHADLSWEPPVEVTEVTEGVVFEADGVRIVAAATDHRPVQPTVGYRVERAGHAVVLAGDTVPCAGLDLLCAGADALVCTVIRDDILRSIGLPRLIDVCDYHSTVEQAADTAQRAGVGTLVLTHCVPPVAPGAEEEWRAIATATFDGQVILANDLERLSLGSAVD